MATINSHTDRDGKTTHRVRVKVKGHKVLSKTFTTKTAARTWARSQEVKLRETPHLAASEAHRHTLGDAIDRYLETALADKGERSREDYRRPELRAEMSAIRAQGEPTSGSLEHAEYYAVP